MPARLSQRQNMVARLSHEMRTPLNAVTGFARLMRLDPALADNRTGIWAAEIEKSAGYLMVMVDEKLGHGATASHRAAPHAATS